MPLYDVMCHTCGTSQEVRLPQFDSVTPACVCGGTQERQVSAPAGFILLGSGTFDHGYVSKTAKE